MPSSQQFLTNYNNDRANVNQLSTGLAQDTQDGAAMPRMIKDALNSRYNNFSAPLTEEASAKAQLFNAPSQAQSLYQGISNPFDRDALVQGNINNAQKNYDIRSGVSKTIFDNLDNIIGQGVNGWNTTLSGKKILLDNANNQATGDQNLYGTALGNETSRHNADLTYSLSKMQLDAQKAGTDALLKASEDQKNNYINSIPDTIHSGDPNYDTWTQSFGQYGATPIYQNQDIAGPMLYGQQRPSVNKVIGYKFNNGKIVNIK